MLQLLENGHFTQGDRARYAPVVHSLVERDEYLILADYRAYIERQQETCRWVLRRGRQVAAR